MISLVRIIKRSEEFNKAKLIASMTKAGAKDGHATKVADKIEDRVKPETTTIMIRRWVIKELTPLDPRAAKAYEKYRKKVEYSGRHAFAYSQKNPPE